MGLFSSNGPSPTTARQKYMEQCQQAQFLITKHRKDIQSRTSDYETVANSQYAYYGWRGSIAFTLFGGSMLVGERIPVFRTYMSWVGLLGGYFLGNYAHAYHIDYMKKIVVSEIDIAVQALEPMAEKYGVVHECVVGGDVPAPLAGGSLGMLGNKPSIGGKPQTANKKPSPVTTFKVPAVEEYSHEIKALTGMREMLAPSKLTLEKQAAAAASQEMSLDDRVDSIVNAYAAKKSGVA